MNTSLKENNKPILVGLTGGIGSGKTTIAKIFEVLGVPVFYSDIEAKKIINHHPEVIKEVKAVFGDVYDAKGLNSKRIADLVFQDKTTLEKLNSIIHPKVKERFNDWISENKEAAILLKEAAILIETEAYKELDEMILVTAPIKIRIERVIKRDGTTNKKVVERMSSQFSDEKKLTYCNFIINNTDEQLVIPQVIKILEKLKSRI